MNEPKLQDTSNQHRIVGEDIPRWLTAAFAVMGTLIAAGAAWLWLNRATPVPDVPPRSEAPVAQSAPPASPPAVAAPVTPAPAPADVPKPMVAVEPQPAGAAAPVQAPVATGDAARAPAAADSPVEAPSPVATPRMPKECPSLMVVPFKFDSAIVMASDVTARIEEISKWLNDEPGAKLSVQGYADSVGWDQYNLLLSYRRAKAVVAVLNKAGIPAQRISIRAAGSHEPIDGIPADAAENRRATMQVVGVKDCP